MGYGNKEDVVRGKKRVYLSGPISIGDKWDHLGKALKVYEHLVELGYAPMCPQLAIFLHPFINYGWATWLSIDLPFVEVCDVVYRLHGYSEGADLEVEVARERGIPIVYSVKELCACMPLTSGVHKGTMCV